MSNTSSTSRPQRKRTQPSYVDEQPLFTSEEEEEGEGDETARSQPVNKGKSKARKSKGKGKERAPAASSDDDELDSSSSEAEQPRKKRKKATKKQRKNKKGKGVQQPELLSSLPVELFTEIVSYCTPGDLLSLSRCSKTFRALLISSNSASLWKAARRSVDLPDLTAGDLTELQYAQLVYNTHCELCGHKGVKFADYAFRKRLCKPCRKETWAKLNWKFARTRPDLHPAAQTLCVTTAHKFGSAEYSPWHSFRVYGYLPELEDISDQLYAFEKKQSEAQLGDTMELDEDVDEDEQILRKIFEETQAEQKPDRFGSTRTRQPRRPSQFGHASSEAPSPAPVDEEDEEDEYSDDEDPSGAGVEEHESVGVAQEQFKKERRELRDKKIVDGQAILKVVKSMRRAESEQQRRQAVTRKDAVFNRRYDIEHKILALGEYTRSDFSGTWYTSKIVNSPEALTDEDWDATVKAKVIKLLARIKTQQDQIEVVNEQHERQQLLRPRYQKLLNTHLDEQARHAVPLFIEFLHLDSVKPLWEPEDADPEDDAAWAEQFDAMIEELDDHRISVRVEAVKTILAATTEMTEEELDGDADDFSAENGYDDDWLARPVSFLVCNLPKCRVKRKWDYRGGLRVEARPTFFGSLPDLLAHQHKCHANLTLTSAKLKKRDKAGIFGHFHLPPLVASMLSSVIEVGQLKDDKTTVADLTAVTRGAPATYRVRSLDAYFEYENTPGTTRYFSRWQDLMEEAIKQSEKAAKQKRTPKVPCIALYDRIADREDKNKARKKAQQEKEKQKKAKQRKRKKRGRDVATRGTTRMMSEVGGAVGAQPRGVGGDDVLDEDGGVCSVAVMSMRYAFDL